jgi:hypothetical protein
VNRIQDETGANVQIDQRTGECVVFGRGLHSSTSQLNLSRFCHSTKNP